MTSPPGVASTVVIPAEAAFIISGASTLTKPDAATSARRMFARHQRSSSSRVRNVRGSGIAGTSSVPPGPMSISPGYTVIPVPSMT